jgi:anti-sigma B factor antagonist
MTAEYTLHPQGDIDLATVGSVRDQWLQDLAEHRPDRAVIDLSDVPFLDSMGLGAIVSVHRHQRSRGGSVTIRNASPTILKLLQITGMHLVMDVEGATSGIGGATA